MTASRFQTNVQSVVLQHLESGPKSVKDIEKITKINYYSIRKAIVTLEAEGTVRPTGHAARNKKYMLGENPNQLANIIPTINDGSSVHKAIVLLRLRHSKKTQAEEAITSLPRSVARLFNLVLRLENGDPVPEMSIALLNKELIGHREALAKVLRIYDQLIDDSRFWDINYLSRMAKDYDFDPEEVQDAYNHYFKKDD